MVNISGGPLSYNYPIYDISLHFGLRDEIGSEHSIDGSQYAGEVSSRVAKVVAIHNDLLTQ